MMRSGGRRGTVATVLAGGGPVFVLGWKSVTSLSAARKTCRSRWPSTGRTSICTVAVLGADLSRRFAPAPLSACQRYTANGLAGTQQGRRPLNLLDGEEPQRVAHQDSHAVVAGAACDAPL